MKYIVCIAFLFISMSFAACKDNPVEQYGDTVIEKLHQTEQTGDTASLRNLQQQIRAFRITNGRFPEDIEELEKFMGLTLDKTKFSYDPATGTLTRAKGNTP